MTVVMDRGFQERLEQVARREWWPVASLAEVLGKPKSYIYRRIENEDFAIFFDGGYMKIEAESVVKYFHGKYQ